MPSKSERAAGRGGFDNVVDVYPLSPMQEGMLYQSLYMPGSGVYVTQMLSRLDGELDTALLERCWQAVVARHPILRTSFVWGDLKSWAQVVRPEVDLPFGVEDVAALATEQQERVIRERRRHERLRGFELGQAPLMRLVLFRRAERRHELLWSFHHLLLDGWSVHLLLAEIYELYTSSLEAREPRLPQRRPFRDYILWLQHQDTRAAEAFWRRELGGFRGATSLSFAAPEGGAAGPAAQVTRRRELSTERSTDLRAFCQRHRLTLNTLVQGAWGLVLGRSLGGDEVIFGTGVSGRPAELEGADRMIGMFVNTQPVRVACPPRAAVVPWLGELQGRQIEARRFEHTPLVEVQRWSGLPGGTPLFEAGLTFENFPSALIDVPEGQEVDAPLVIGGIETFDQTEIPLTLGVTPGRRIVLRADYRTDRVAETAADRLLGHVETALAGIAAGAATLDEVPWLAEGERRQLLAVGRGDGDPAPSPVFLHRLFERQAAAAPDRTALSGDGLTVTYGELERRSNRWARALRSLGVGPETRVGVFLERSSPEVPVALLAVLKAGAAYVPLDLSYPRERLEWMAADGALGLLLTVEPLRGEAPAIGAGRVVCLDLEADLAAAEPPEPLPDDPPHRAAVYVVYTSGSTGRPRGVVADHGSLGLRMRGLARMYGFGPGDRLLQLVPLSFDAHVEEIYPVLTTGATLVLRQGAAELAPAELLAEVHRLEIDSLHIPPALWHGVVEHLIDTGEPVPPMVRRVITGGEAPAPQRLAEWARRSQSPNRFWNGYGPAEATFGCSSHQASMDPERLDRLERLPAGRPWPHNRLYVLGPHLDLLPVGVTGEICVGSDLLTRGYHGLPGVTAERFLPDPFADRPGCRMYRTGDSGRWRDDGEIDFLGRIDHQVKIRGVRVEPGEVEAALAEHPAVRDAAVVVREVEPLGRCLVAYFSAKRDALADVGALRDHLAARLPAPMVPSLFVPLDRLPLSPNGKIDRRALPAPARPAAGERRIEPPRDEVERRLVALWTSLLGVEEVSVGDDFFALGGHSLLAVRLMAQIHQQFGRRLPLAALVEGRTLRAVAELLRRPADELGWQPLVALRRGGERPPLFCVHPVGGEVMCYLPLAGRLGEDRPVYGLQAPALRDTQQSPSIEALADAYLEAVRGVQPEGPYHLCGWSFGAFVAFEMACRLERAGEAVAGLYLLDTWAPLFDEPPPDEDVQMLIDLARDRAHHLGLPEPEVSIEEYRGLGEEERLERYLELLRREGLVPADVDGEVVRSILRGYRSRRQAVERYRPGSYGGRIDLFVAGGQDDAARLALLSAIGLDPADATLCWGRLTSGSVAVQRIDGQHHTLFEEPQVATLAECLRRAMDLGSATSGAYRVAGWATSNT